MKLLRAQDHLEQIDAAITGWVDEALRTVWEEPDPDGSGYCFTWINPRKRFPAESLSVLLGDCLQCYRSALDHLAFELASAFTVPMTDPVEEKSEFPILNDVDRNGKFGVGPTKWASRLTSARVCGMDPHARTEIERLQPYHRGEAFKEDPLWRLQALNVFDKHRTLHVLAINSVATQLSFGAMENVSALTFDTPDALVTLPGPVEGPTKVNRWRVAEATPVRPKQKVRVKFPPALAVLFDEETPVVGGEGVLATVAAIDKHILSDVFPPLVGFLN